MAAGRHGSRSGPGRAGRVQQTVTFTIEMPEAISGYANHLDTTDGDSTATLTDGLYYAMGLGDYYGYTFFFDNDGVLRYEMVLEGFHSDRFLYTDGGLYTCVSSRKIALMSPLGQAVRVYDLGQYELHHDINWGPDGTILALVNDTEQDTVMDVVVSLNPETGEVSEVVDFSELMDGYYGEMTHPVPITGGSFWQAGEDDWLHLNSVQYMEKDDSILVSSRETSTIIKVSDIQGTPTLSAFIGDPAFWADTPYADLCYAMDGDFVAQYGQHDVELVADDSLEDGQYLLRMYDNNYWSLSTRDGYDPELADSVSTSLTSGDASYITFYLVDDNTKTFSLVEQHAVPYSAIVSRPGDRRQLCGQQRRGPPVRRVRQRRQSDPRLRLRLHDERLPGHEGRLCRLLVPAGRGISGFSPAVCAILEFFGAGSHGCPLLFVRTAPLPRRQPAVRHPGGGPGPSAAYPGAISRPQPPRLSQKPPPTAVP